MEFTNQNWDGDSLIIIHFLSIFLDVYFSVFVFKLSESLIKSLLYFISKVHETLAKFASGGTINWTGIF